MTITDIAERLAEERKREKRLVHVANTLGRGFVESLKLKQKAEKTDAEYFTKSFLDYVFFVERKEISEVNEALVKSFLLDYALEKLSLAKETLKDVPSLLLKLCDFLDAGGYIKNVLPLQTAIKENSKGFLKAASGKGKSISPQKKDNKVADKPTPKAEVGRNDPCPCGSGKKYKKCCGRLK